MQEYVFPWMCNPRIANFICLESLKLIILVKYLLDNFFRSRAAICVCVNLAECSGNRSNMFLMNVVFFSSLLYTFFYKQLVYKQLVVSLKRAKQLWGLNHLAISNNIKLQITENGFVKDCSGVNQSLKI